MKYVTKAQVIVWQSIWPVRVGKRGEIGVGKLLESNSGKNGYAFIESPIRGYVALALLEKIVNPPPPPVLGDDIWWTSYWTEKPNGLKPEGINNGSFAIGWLLPEQPEEFINKPAGFVLAKPLVDGIRRFNPQNPGALNWLVDQTGNKDVLSVSSDGVYRCPVPCFSENNPVRVLELTNRFARIETVSIYDPLPDTLPPHLLHTWYGYTNGKIYKIQGAKGGINYPLFARSNSAWVDLRAIQREKPNY